MLARLGTSPPRPLRPAGVCTQPLMAPRALEQLQPPPRVALRTSSSAGSADSMPAASASQVDHGVLGLLKAARPGRADGGARQRRRRCVAEADGQRLGRTRGQARLVSTMPATRVSMAWRGLWCRKLHALGRAKRQVVSCHARRRGQPHLQAVVQQRRGGQAVQRIPGGAAAQDHIAHDAERPGLWDSALCRPRSGRPSAARPPPTAAPWREAGTREWGCPASGVDPDRLADGLGTQATPAQEATEVDEQGRRDRGFGHGAGLRGWRSACWAAWRCCAMPGRGLMRSPC